MARKRPASGIAAAKRSPGPFVAIPTAVLNHPNFGKLRPVACRLLLQMCAKLRFKTAGPCNNGDLECVWSDMQHKGWESETTLRDALAGLVHYGYLVLTRQGGKNIPNLYAIGWYAIDHCDGKLDVAPTAAPLDLWRDTKSTFKPKSRKRKQNHSPRSGGNESANTPAAVATAQIIPYKRKYGRRNKATN